jgi:hypothetical protein
MDINMNVFKIIFCITGLVLIMAGCSENPYYDIPTDENGNVIITEVSSVTTTGITEDDAEFTVIATLPNARQGDVMLVDLLKPQPHPNSESNQLLPIEGTRKESTVDSNLQATVTFSKEEAQMQEVGDWVEVIFNGATDSAQIRVTLQPGSGE